MSDQVAPWPLLGSAEFARIDPGWRASLARRFAVDLQRHVVDVWFPRCVDREAGGFLCDFDHRWRPRGAQRRMLEFQARQTRSAARLGIAFPSQAQWPDIALHGLRYLREVMLDAQDGGFFCMVDRDGVPQAAGTKHAHGTAYVIGAGVDTYLLTGAREALELAGQAFDWLERSVHDGVHGGYHGWTTRAGQVILRADDVPAPQGRPLREPLGHGIGHKDANVHSDLLESFAQLYDVSHDELVLARLAETYELLTTRFGTAAGSMHYALYPDLTPVPGVERYGYPLQTAPRLHSAGTRIGVEAAMTAAAAQAMVDHSIEWALDTQRGGFLEAGPAAPPLTLTGTPLRVVKRPWWVQGEAATALLWGTLVLPDGQRYRPLLDQLVDFIEVDFLDRRWGGWRTVARGDWSWRWRLPGRELPKGDMWKDASHETDVYLPGIRMLRGLGPEEPLEAGGAAAATSPEG